MTLPAGVETRTVEITVPIDVLGGDAKAYSGVVKADRALVWAATGEPIWPVPANLPAPVDGKISFDVPIVDQAGMVDAAGAPVTGWKYRVTLTGTWSGASRTTSKAFQVVEADPAVVDLDVLLDSGLTPPVVEPNPYVQNVAGRTGTVTADQLADALGGLFPAAPLPYLDGVAMFIYGDSYTQLFPPESTPGPRIAKQHNMLPPVNRGVSGSTFRQIFDRVAATWTPNTAGLVVIGDGTINNIQAYPDTTAGRTTSREAFRALLAYLSARGVVNAVDAGSSTQFGPGWTASAEGFAGGVGSYVDIAWDAGPSGERPLDVFLRLRSGTGGTIEVRRPDGTVAATKSTGGFSEDITGVVSVPYIGTGVRTVRAVVTAGTVTVQRVACRAVTPPSIVWDKAGPIPFGGPSIGTTKLRAFQAVEIEAANEFDVIVSDNDVPGWDPEAMIVDDLAHRNDEGNRFATETMDAALREALTDFRQGLNSVTRYTADVPYVAPAGGPSYSGPGAALPAAPVLSAAASNQVRLTWTRPVDNGATITGYEYQTSPAGAGTWSASTAVPRGAVSRTIEAGLTATSSYDFRIRAINSVGAGSWSNTATATAGTAATAYSRDDFDRADSISSLGNAVVGGAWTVSNSTFGIKADKAYASSTAKTNPTLYNFATVTDGQSGGYVQATIAKQDSIAAGIVMCANAAASTTAMVLYSHIAKGVYQFAAQTAAATYVIVAEYAIVPQDGDTIGIHHDGLNYTAVINGIVQPTWVGSVNFTGTRHGLFCWGAGAEWEDYSHTNFDPR